ncbi:MAG: hypothetical protein ACU84H_11325 [Gammaproteobacteria bacterium]
MSPLQKFFQETLPLALQEFVVALLRQILLLLILPLILVLKFWEWLKRLWRSKNLFEEETEEGCGRLPDPLIRRPDPCIYSQQFLQSQGLPVTWNNPDIWVAPADNPGAIEPDSYHLKDDTDYIVSVQAHNVSTDPAIGVRVRLVYRPWSFNSPDLVPVETDASGNEVFKCVDIPAMGAAVAQFKWHTPPVATGESQHFCLQAHLSHPMDINTANNMGQENTNVHSQNPGFVSPGETAEIEVPLFNTRRRAQTVRLRWDAYQINTDDKLELNLKATLGRPRMPLSSRLGHMLPTVTPPPSHPPPIESATVRPPTRPGLFGSVTFQSPKLAFRAVKTKYVGFEALRQQILSRDYSLPEGMTVMVEDDAPRLERQEQRVLKFRIQVPGDAQPATRLPVNIVAEDEDGGLIGGVTVYFHIRP